MKTFYLMIALFLCINNVWATTYQAAQGDVLRIPAPHFAKGLNIKVFGKNWPIYQHQGKKIAWVGIDLKTKAKSYDITWSSGHQHWLDKLEVKKGDFRISHIEVKKSMSSFDKAAIKRIQEDQKAIKTAYKTAVTSKNDWPEMIWPVKGIISTPFAAQRYVNGKARSPHSGVDIAAIQGTPVLAPLAGKVLLVSDMFLNGTLVAIGHGDGLTSVYAHLYKALVKEGDLVKQGDVFAEVGSTGRSTGPHLHWGVHFSGAKINPEAMLTSEHLK